MNAAILKVTLQLAAEAPDLPDAAGFSSWANAAAAADELQAVAKSGRSLVTIRVVGEQESRTLNGDFRNADKATNVLAFPADFELSLPPDEVAGELGDLAICYAVVAREAQLQGKTLRAHMAHMTVHGILHLLGYDHLDATEAEVMETLETRIMTTLGFPDPYLY